MRAQRRVNRIKSTNRRNEKPESSHGVGKPKIGVLFLFTEIDV
jgi:hypothetical protein